MRSSINLASSLEDRRPRRLRDIVGNHAVVSRLGMQMRNGRPPGRILRHGPSGAGKTTLARIVARYAFCLNPLGVGDSCGHCAHCMKDLDSFSPYHEWTGNQVADGWQWWKENMGTILGNPGAVVFIDEAQELEKRQQSEFRTRLERAVATSIFTTTHVEQLDDALFNRFGINEYKLKRPTTEEVVDHMQSLCARLGVTAGRDRLHRVATHLGRDLRKCVDFVHTALEQTVDGVVDDAFIDAVLGVEPASQEPSDPPRPRSKSRF